MTDHDEVADNLNSLAEKLITTAAMEGKAIELGWTGYRVVRLNKDKPDLTADELASYRTAFFQGARHLINCMMSFPSADDDFYNAMDSLKTELEVFHRQDKIERGLG